MIKKLLSITGFVFVLLFALVAFKASGYVSFVLFLALAFWISPFSDFLKKSFKRSKGKRALSIAGGILVFLFAIGTFPTSEPSSSVAEEPQLTIETTESDTAVIDRTLPPDDYQDSSEIISEEEVVDTTSEEERFNIIVADSHDDALLSPSPNESIEIDSQNDCSISAENEPSIVVAPEESTVNQTNDVTEPQVIEPSPSVVDTPDTAQATTSGSDGSGYNFDTYYIPENQQTTETWVLNTSTMRVHHPSCKDVVKIKPENYATSSLSLEELIAAGYKPCGHCFK